MMRCMQTAHMRKGDLAPFEPGRVILCPGCPTPPLAILDTLNSGSQHPGAHCSGPLFARFVIVGRNLCLGQALCLHPSPFLAIAFATDTIPPCVACVTCCVGCGPCRGCQRLHQRSTHSFPNLQAWPAEFVGHAISEGGGYPLPCASCHVAGFRFGTRFPPSPPAWVGSCLSCGGGEGATGDCCTRFPPWMGLGGFCLPLSGAIFCCLTSATPVCVS
jgi:hypothetical protein